MSGFVFEDHIYFNDEYKAELKGYPLSGEGEIRSLAKGQFIAEHGRRQQFLDGASLFIITPTDKIQRMDLQSGQLTTLLENIPKMGPRMSYHEGKVYFEQSYYENELAGSILMSIDVQTLQIDTIINKQLESGWQGGFAPPTIIVRGDKTMLAFQLREAGPLATGRQSYYMYNEDADSLVWSNEAIDDAQGGIGEPAFDDERVYWMGNTSVFALNLETGKLEWRHDNPDQKGHWHGFAFMHEDKLVVKSDGMIITALHPATGNVIWMNEESGSTPADTYEVFDGAVCFYSSGKGYFSAVDLQTGKSLIYERSPVKNYDNDPTMGTSIIIDDATRRMYYANFSHVVCLKIAPFDR